MKTGGQTDYYPLQLVDTHMDGRMTGNYDPFLEHNKISFKMNSKHPINQNQNK